MKKYLKLMTLWLIAAIFLSNCDSGSPVSLSGKITGPTISLGEKTDIANQTIPSTGGKIIYNGTIVSLGGLLVNIPSGSYKESKEFKVTTTQITGHKLGKYFNPISPLITISNGGGYANDVMTVEVPVKIPKGYFAMGFLYNEVTGEVEGMPLIAIKENSVVVGTRHFATSSITGKGGKSLLKDVIKIQGDAIIGNLVISAISIEELKKQNEIVSDFEPGTDDWEFTNYGTALEPNGICLGMTISAMWYYYEVRNNGGPKLFHNYDKYTIANYKALWEDNPLGIKLGTMVQIDYGNKDGKYQNTIYEIASDKTKDSLSWYAFAYTILQTKQPQLIAIWSSQGGGHALIANDVWMQDGKLWISDPNHPGNRNINILYTDKEFEPYYASLNAAENPHNYEYIVYAGKTAMVDWSSVSGRWDELSNGTIGKGVFPDEKIWITDPTGDTEGWELTDGLKTVMDTLNLEIKDNNNSDFAFTIYDQEGYSILPNPKESYSMVFDGKIVLKPGLNIIGYCINKKRGNDNWDWADFKWIEVYCQRLKISPDTIKKGELNKDYTWTAKYDGPLTNPIYVWDFGDGKSTSGNSKSATHNYGPAASGLYTITCKLYDGAISKNNFIDSGKAFIFYMGNCYFEIDGVPFNLTSFVAGTYLSQAGISSISSQDSKTGYTLAMWVPGNSAGTFPWSLKDGNPTFQVQGNSMVYLGLPGGSTIITNYGPKLGKIEGTFSGPIHRANINTGIQDTVYLTNGWFSAFNAGSQ